MQKYVTLEGLRSDSEIKLRTLAEKLIMVNAETE